jgi:hypothetical protein
MISAMTMPSVVRCIERASGGFSVQAVRRGAAAGPDQRQPGEEAAARPGERYLEEVQRVIEAASAVESGHYTAGSLASIAHRDDALGRLAAGVRRAW